MEDDMSEKIYVDANGELIGVFGDGAEPPAGAIEVSEICLLYTSPSPRD